VPDFATGTISFGHVSFPIHASRRLLKRGASSQREQNSTHPLPSSLKRFASSDTMGKKSKKGVSRAGAKKHNAAGHGKSTTSTSTSLKGRIRSDSKASFESGSSNNAFNVHDAGVSQNITVNAKEQPAPVSISGMDINMILDILNKENNAAPGPAMQAMMDDIEKILISPPRVPKATDAAKEEMSLDVPVMALPKEVAASDQDPAEVVEAVETNVVEQSEKTPKPSLETVEKVVEAPPVENVAVTVAEIVPPPSVVEPAVVQDSVEVDDQPLFCVSDSPVDADAETEPSKELEAPTTPVPSEPVAEAKSNEPLNVWSSKLRDAVALVDTDEMAHQPPVLDVTPVKQPSKLVVPLIQTVSPSPDTSKHLRAPPTLDTPDAKDVDVKQNECGCIIV
jgi:hypothetical protein